jgi:hypothetical protein
VPKEVRELIRTMSRENPLWGAPRIHGELLKLDINYRRDQQLGGPNGLFVLRMAELSSCRSRKSSGELSNRRKVFFVQAHDHHRVTYKAVHEAILARWHKARASITPAQQSYGNLSEL